MYPGILVNGLPLKISPQKNLERQKFWQFVLNVWHGNCKANKQEKQKETLNTPSPSVLIQRSAD
jgi:hypothetical protein